MFANDFLFNGQRASDFGFVIGGMDSDGEAVVSGGEITINAIKPPANSIHNFYTASLDNVLQYTFGVMKFKCDDPNDIYVTPEEESRIAKWLLRGTVINGYEWLQFDQDYYRDINYRVCFTDMKPIQVTGKTIGFELTCQSNCGYAFSNEKFHRFTISNGTSKSIIVTSDMADYIYPTIKISGGSGNFTFRNENDGQLASEFSSVSSTLLLDCQDDIITGLSDPKNFNWIFPRMVDGENIFKTNSSSTLTVELKYREARRVLV